MNLGALVDLGVPQEHVLSELAHLRLDDEFTLTFAKAEKQGITGTQATVTLSARAGQADHHPKTMNMNMNMNMITITATTTIRINTPLPSHGEWTPIAITATSKK